MAFAALSNGFASCPDPEALQAICDRLGPYTIGVFLERWWARLPLPLTPTDRAGGYWWECSMRQRGVSRTLVFDRPRNGRAFLEALIADSLDLGRPDTMELIFGRPVRSAGPGDAAQPRRIGITSSNGPPGSAPIAGASTCLMWS